MPLAHSGPKAFSFSLRLGQRKQPGLCSGEGAFVWFLANHPPMFHVELFSSVTPFFLRLCLWLSAGRRLFFSLRFSQSNQPGLTDRAGAFYFLSSSHYANVPRGTFFIGHASFSSVMPLALCGPKAFSPARPKKSARPVRQGRQSFALLNPKTHPNVPHGTFFTFQNAKKPGFVRFACFHPPASVL